MDTIKSQYSEAVAKSRHRKTTKYGEYSWLVDVFPIFSETFI